MKRMSEFTLDAKVHFSHPVREVGTNGFQIKQVDVTWEDDRGYQQFAAIDCKFEGVQMAEALKDGDYARFECEVGGREWTRSDGTTKVFTTISCNDVYKIDKDEEGIDEPPF